MVIFEWLVCVCIQYYSVYFLIRSSSLPIFLELIIANVQVFIPLRYVCVCMSISMLYVCCCVFFSGAVGGISGCLVDIMAILFPHRVIEKSFTLVSNLSDYVTTAFNVSHWLD